MTLSDRWARVWPALLAVTVVGAVGTPAAVASYRHARDVVISTGDMVMAPWLPLSVDGMLLASLVVIWVRRHRGEEAGVGPWAAFLFGMVVTVAANLAAVQIHPTPLGPPDGTDYVVALFPPLALAITLELVALVAYRTRPVVATTASEPETTTSEALATTTSPSTSPTTSDLVAITSPITSEPLAVTTTSPASASTSKDAVTTSTTSEPETSPIPVVALDDDEVVERARRLLADGAGRPTLMAELGVNDYKARQLMKRIRQESTTSSSTTTNGKVYAG